MHWSRGKKKRVLFIQVLWIVRYGPLVVACTRFLQFPFYKMHTSHSVSCEFWAAHSSRRHIFRKSIQHFLPLIITERRLVQYLVVTSKFDNILLTPRHMVTVTTAAPWRRAYGRWFFQCNLLNKAHGVCSRCKNLRCSCSHWLIQKTSLVTVCVVAARFYWN